MRPRSCIAVLALAAAVLVGCRRDADDGSAAPQAPPADRTVVAVAAGTAHSCALERGGGVRCWGQNDQGQLGNGTTEPSDRPVRVAGVDDAIAIVAGDRHTCVQTAGGGAKCWGNGAQGQLGHGPGGPGVRSTKPVVVRNVAEIVHLAAGANHTCAATRSGGVTCWGDNRTRQLGVENQGGETFSKVAIAVPGFADAVQVAAGSGHTCARRRNGQVLCWGANGRGQLGDGTDRGHASPSKVGMGAAEAIAARGDRSCAIEHGGGGVRCWGGGKPSPIAVGGLGEVRGIRGIAVGSEHACARAEDGLRCWGANPDGRLGDGTFSTRAAATRVRGLGPVRDVAAGARHTCAVAADGVVSCWGDDLAATSVADPSTGLMPVRDVTDARDLGTGAAFSCAVVGDRSVRCWGDNALGQLGNGTTRSSADATAVTGIDDAVAVAAGDTHACAARSNGQVACWGDNGLGQITPRAGGTRPRPVGVTVTRDAIALAAGRAHTCALERSGAVACWGDDSFGQLGDGTGTAGGRVIGIADAVEIRAGADHTCARRRSGRVSCWGSNAHGQIGNGAGARELAIPVESPRPATRVEGARAIAAGRDHTCAVLQTGKAQCWGGNDQAQLGSGTSSNSWTTRVPVRDLGGGTAVGAGDFHTCAMTSTGLRCWGANEAGQLGNPPRPVVPTPAPGPALEALQIDGGAAHTCARTRDGAVTCWGSDGSGQLGHGSRAYAKEPIPVPGM